MKRIHDYKDSVYAHYETGTYRGMDTGFTTFNNLISFKPGYTTYIQGHPKAGKTEIHLEILFNLTEKYGTKHALMSSEIGSPEDIIGELVSKHLRKPFFKSSGFAPTDAELFSAISYLDQYFFVVDSDNEDMDVNKFYDQCKKIEKDFSIKLGTTSIDPWNDLDEDLLPHGGREDKYLNYALKKVRKSAKINEWHNFIITHSRDEPGIFLDTKDGAKIQCAPVPTLRSFAGGQVWPRKAFNVIGVWRPEEGTIDPATGDNFKPGEAIVLVLKSKPKGSGKTGRMSIYFDWKLNRYYEIIDGVKFYAFEREKYLKNGTAPKHLTFDI